MSQFQAAKPRKWATGPHALFNALQLAWRCRLDLDAGTLNRLRNIPDGAGLILVCNHADEMDIRVLMEFARRARKQFLFMVNKEAFEEMRGFAGYWLSRVGCFSVERGTSDVEALDYASEIIRGRKQALVMFPEG